MKELKVAYVHDWLVVNGGAEKVAKAILEIYPNAQVYSLIDFLNEKDRHDILQSKKSTTSFIQRLPFAKKFYRFYLPLFPLAIEQLDLREFDLIISSSYSVAKGVLTNADQVHVCYCHSPVRYAWDLYFNYLEDNKINRGLKAWYIKRTLHKLRIWDYIAAQRVDYFIANSHNVAKRIKKIYNRDAEVVYPPVNTSNFVLNSEPRKDYYLTASRLVPYKKMDIIIEAFKQMPDKQLLVLGDGPEFNKLKKMASKNIQIKGYCSLAELTSHMQQAKAFVFAPKEDFGIVPIEAMACGTPVIAFGKGGALETVTEKSGMFFYEQSVDSIVKAIGEFEKNINNYKSNEIRENSERFTSDKFKTEFQKIINKVTKNA